MQRTYQHLFGPVPSRRLGRSLGVDLVPFKTCSYDCIFCQLGRTTDLTLARRPHVTADDVGAELANWLAAGGMADYVTLAGSGEPTLNSELGAIVDRVRSLTRIPIALLSNGSLFGDPEVRRQAARARLVKVSMSAWDDTSLRHVNRPHPGLAFAEILEGQRLFRKEFEGELWVEVFLAWGTNSTPKDVARIADVVRTIGADRVQLNTAVRPPCEEFARAVPPDTLASLAPLFDPPAEVIAEYGGDLAVCVRASEDDVEQLLKRRPCTLNQICGVFNLHPNEATKIVGRLARCGKIEVQRQAERQFYRAVAS